LDLFEVEQLERAMMIKAKAFLGNKFSSFSQVVAFSRQAHGLNSNWWNE